MGVNMKHIVRFTAIGLTFFFVGAATPVTGNRKHQTATESTAERNKALVLKWSDALRNRDMATAQALTANDWVLHDLGFNYSRGFEGVKQWQAFIDARWVAPEWATRAEEDIFAEGDKVARRGPVYRTGKANNKESVMTVVFIYRIADGKIAEVWRVADALTSYQQTGAQIIMPGTNVDAAQPTSALLRPEKVAEQKSTSEQKISPSTEVIDDTNIAKRETPSAVTTERNKALVSRWAEAVWSKDMATAQSLVTDDCGIHAAGSTYAKGPEGIKQWLAEADSNWSYGGSTTDDVIAEGNKVARRTTVFAMYKPNHRSTVTSVIFIYRVADGKIAEVWRVANYVSTYLQAGARIIMPGETERSVKKTEAEQEVLKAKQEFDDAALRNDADGRARFYADDYFIVYNDGTLGNKAKQVERVRSGRLRYLARTAEDVVVRVYGETALIIERRKQSATFDGRPRPSDVRASEVWVKREGQWQLVSTQITTILEPISGPLLQGEAARQPPEASKSAIEPVGTETAPEIEGGTSQAQQEILKALQEASEATPRNDADAVARILSDDSLFVIYNGALQINKDSQVESLRTGFMRFSAAAVQDVVVRVYGDSAVVIKRRKQVATVGGRTRPGDVRMTNVWVKRQGRWQEVFVQVTPIIPDSPAASRAEQEVLALEEQMEGLQRSNSAGRTALWAEDMVYINNNGAVFDKARLAPAVSAGEVKVDSLEVTERKIRVYRDVAVVTALEHMRANYHQRGLRDFVQRYTRVWVRRDSKWQMASFQATRISEPTVRALPTEVEAPEKPQTGPNPARDKPGTDSSLEQQIVSLDEEFEEYRRRDQAGDKMLGDDYIGVPVSGRTLDKAATIELFRSGRVQTKSLEISGRNVRVYGDTAIVIVTRDLNDALEGIPRQEQHRCTKVWVKRNDQWQVVSFQATKIPPLQDTARGLAPSPGDANRAQDEATIRKIVADNTEAWNRRDAKAQIAHFSEDIDHIGVQGLWRSNKAELEKGFTTGLPTTRNVVSSSVERIHFLTPDVAVVIVRREYVGEFRNSPGHDKETRKAISTSVFYKVNGNWLIEAFQNTYVQSREEAIAQAAKASGPITQAETEVITKANSKTDFSGDVAAIRKMVADSDDAWNRRDPKALAAHGSENHDHINVIGAWRQGKAETEKAMTAALATTRNNISSSIAKIRFITPDVAIVIVRHQYTNDKEALQSISTSVLHKMNGEWWNEAFQNTYIRPR
jgi:uncharacterized protein (TIGR02246 family)